MTIFHLLQTQKQHFDQMVITKLHSQSLQSQIFIKMTKSFQKKPFFMFLDDLKSNTIYWGLKRLWSTMTAILLYLGRRGACI